MDVDVLTEYEKHVMELLEKYVKSQNSGNMVLSFHFRNFKIPNSIEWERIPFDMVEVNKQLDIKKVYEVCTYSNFTKNIISLQKKLQHYKELTDAEVFLVYLNYHYKEYLQVLPLSEVTKKANERIKENAYKQSKQKTIKSFTEFYTIINQLYNNSFLDRLFFRGHSNKEYEPIPGIYRNGNIYHEKDLYYEAVRQLPTEFTEGMSTFDHLVKMQHYELPTRLLDVTTNPMVALYFACQENDGADGDVLVYEIGRDSIKNHDDEWVCILANLAKCRWDFCKQDDPFGEIDRFLEYIQKDRPNFKVRPSSLDLNTVLCVLPKLNNSRIISQRGAFFIFGMGYVKNEPAIIHNNHIEIIIKAEAKKEILKELERIGINEASMFPETDKILKQIKQKVCG